MDNSYPNPYAALIATFNQVSPLDSNDDPDDPQHLPDDDLLLWANAQFTYDIPPGVGIYEDDMAVKMTMSPQRLQQTQQQQYQPQPQTQVEYQSTDTNNPQQQLDAIRRYLEGDAEDPKVTRSLVERSRQKNPMNGVTTASSLEQAMPNEARVSTLYAQGHVDSTPFSTPTSSVPIGFSAVRQLPPLRQPLFAIQSRPHLHYSSATTTPLPSPTTTNDFHQLQINTDGATKYRIPYEDNEHAALGSPTNSTSSSKVNASSSRSPLEKRLSRLESELQELENDEQDEHPTKKSNSSPSSSSASPFMSANAQTADDGTFQDPSDIAAAKLAAEEDKRRRNTAASARFRHKKRLREQILEKTAKEMTAKAELLELRVRELEMEIKWLRGLIIEKDSRILDVGLESSISLTSTASASSPLSSTALDGIKSEVASSTRTSKKRGKKSQA
ncbi:hypothetical protein BGZ51_005216 [Haplosporangium sp. Z 767]|nr:hypothetical protein BGZ50_008513 [Haplosporangium sp. Z 11]KAF9192626.1 hypothetical protein BGZ51_005216 [Haplosporangium sp. Z 767]